MSRPPRVLIIAGSDSGGGAGIQADIKTVAMLGGHAMTAVTAITAQNTLGVTGVWPLPAEAVIAQIDAVVSDIGVDAVKIGMIGLAEVAHAVAERLEALAAEAPGIPIVFDPVMVATSGSVLADEVTIAAFSRLMRLATMVTPNAPELAVLASRPIKNEDDLTAAARFLVRTIGSCVLAKGGHLEGERVTDILVYQDADGLARWSRPRIETRHSHGTGCTLASGIATALGAGLDLAEAVFRAQDFVQAALLAAPGYGAGHGPMGHALGGVPFDVMASA